MAGTGWQAELLDFRARKDAYFRSGRGPLPQATLAAFAGLAYFPPDPTWHLSLSAERLPPEAVTLPTTTPGEMQRYLTWGRVKLPGGESLTLYAREGDDASGTLFVPFRDATSGAATYGAGRYLDASVAGETVMLDFNRAYHPYCAFNDAWTCPLPPAENRLHVAVEAGERLA
ncbi:DUF1684 domain-containing protein [Deinococcus sp.]|uniref:DUF1684 domain-containing protein n=1 Tax=Deinococcus sp. TaxID=47478 RepID=UPI003B5AAE08